MIQKVFHMANTPEDVDETVIQVISSIESAVSATLLTRVKICLSEALYNNVLHAQVDDKSGSISITIALKDGSLDLEIFDPIGAAPFDISAHAPDLAEVDLMAENGRGLGLIMECADSVNYGPSSEGHNRLVLGFKS